MTVIAIVSKQSRGFDGCVGSDFWSGGYIGCSGRWFCVTWTVSHSIVCFFHRHCKQSVNTSDRLYLHVDIRLLCPMGCGQQLIACTWMFSFGLCACFHSRSTPLLVYPDAYMFWQIRVPLPFADAAASCCSRLLPLYQPWCYSRSFWWCRPVQPAAVLGHRVNALSCAGDGLQSGMLAVHTAVWRCYLVATDGALRSPAGPHCCRHLAHSGPG